MALLKGWYICLHFKEQEQRHKTTNTHAHKHTIHIDTLTCGDKEDSCTEDDVVSAPVKLTGGHTEAPQEQQTHTHDGEDTGGTHSPWTHTRTKPTDLKMVHFRLHIHVGGAEQKRELSNIGNAIIYSAFKKRIQSYYILNLPHYDTIQEECTSTSVM